MECKGRIFTLQVKRIYAVNTYFHNECFYLFYFKHQIIITTILKSFNE